MKTKKQSWKSFVAFLCIVLIMVYASVVFLPHSHEFSDFDCAICSTIESSRSILLGLVLSATIYQLTNFALVIPRADTYIHIRRESTPVELKVKLSD